jgi:phosphoribosyl-ATP pyrophosphohydrolase
MSGARYQRASDGSREESLPMLDQNRTALQKLQDEYIEAVNAAIGEDREDLVEELVASYPDAAMRLLTEDEYRPAA